MNKELVNLLFSVDEPFAAGLLENSEKSEFYRMCLGFRRYFEHIELPKWQGEALYPVGRRKSLSLAVRPDKSAVCIIDKERLSQKIPAAVTALDKLEFTKFRSMVPPLHAVGGNLYTHSMPNYKRIIKEGLNSYCVRINNLPQDDFHDGLLELIAGIRAYHARVIEYLITQKADSALIAALQKVPFSPAETLYEAVVAWNFIFYLDDCDNIGRLDAGLSPYHKGEDIVPLLRALFQNIDENDGWTGAVGPLYTPITLQCLEAIKGFRRPSLELRILKDMPEEVWDAAVYSIKTGGGQPSLYNEEVLQAELHRRFPQIPQKDAQEFCGGGCTEFMLEGISNVGSIDAGINLAYVFKTYLEGSFSQKESFESFYKGFLDEAKKITDTVVSAVSFSRAERARLVPNPMRTLLVDDCIDKGLDFNAGGARYMWSIINFAGIINVIDSMCSIKELVYEKKAYSPETFLQLLNAEDEQFFRQLSQTVHFGTDCEEANEMAQRISHDICMLLEGKKDAYAMGYLPASIQFTTYADAGAKVGPTPDGRKDRAPLCDSLAAVLGHDSEGTTALIKSVTALELSKMLGMPVFNLNIHQNFSDATLKALFKAYIALGGVQMQVTVTTKEDIKKALENPEAHKNLIVRIGGFAEYFYRLSPALQEAVAERILHE